MPLPIAPLDIPLRVLSVKGNEKDRRHLETLGLTKNMKIELMSSQGGSVICRLNDSRLALDMKTAFHVLVEVI